MGNLMLHHRINPKGMWLRELSIYSHYAFWMLPQCLSENKVVAVEEKPPIN